MSSKRSDVVLSMTLAETFLLLLFLIWLGDVARNSGEQPPTDPTIIRIENARLKAENDRLVADSQRFAAEIRNLQLIVDVFRKTLGITDPTDTPEQVPTAVKTAADAARRGAPKCASDNVFARVVLRNGAAAFTVTAPPSVAQ